MRNFVLMLAVASSSCFAQPVPTDDDAFTTYAAERMAKELPEYNVRPAGKLTLEGKRSDGESTGQLSLDRVYAYCSRNAQNCSAAIDQYAKGMAESVKERNRPIERNMVRVAIRPAAYVEQIRKQFGGTANVYTKPVTQGLVAIAVLDFTRSVRFVNDKDLSKLALSEAELIKLGEENLRSSIKSLAEVAPVPTANSFGRISGEDYATSRILFLDDWRELSSRLNGKLVVMLPAPDVLLYGDGSSAVGVEALRTFANEVARKSSRPLSPILLQWSETGWSEVK